MFTLYFYNSGGEREQHGTHATLEEALAEKAGMQAEYSDFADENFEVVLQFI